ncbi:unnamed protein product, partial [Porites lobata]
MPQDSTGLAFSGGGIRSAAFCSGVLRSLLKSRVEVDYLSCVSGGGYTGTAYLDWKYREKKKDKTREGEGETDWHEEFFNHMKDRSGYICDWTGFWKGVFDTFFFVSLITIVLLVHPVIQWGAYAFPVAVMIDLFGIGNLMRKAADCDAAFERQREMNESAVPGKDVIDRCLNRSPKLWTQVMVGILAVIVWVTIPFLRRKTSYVLIVYVYSFVIYWKVFRVDLPVFFIKHEDRHFHWLLFASGVALVISPFTTTLKEKLVFVYNRWRLQKAFYHENSTRLYGCLGICPQWLCCLCNSKNETRPLTLADLKDMKPEYISNIVVNRWKNNEKDKTNYTLLTMSPSGIQRFDQSGKGQFEGKLEPEDIMLSEAMAISAAALSKHMGKYEESIEGLTRLHTILGLEMGSTKISDSKHRKQSCAFKKMKELVTYILSGIPLTIPSIFYYHDHNHYELSLVCSVGIFFGIHVMLAVIAVLDSGCEKNPIKVHSSEVEEQIEKGGENVVLVPDLGVEERRETATTVPDQGAEAQKEGYEETVVPASDLGVEETIEKCGESAMPVPGSEGQEEGCEETVIARPGLRQEEQKRNETVIQVPDSVVEETATPGPVSDENKEQNEGCPESDIPIPDLEVQEPGFCEKIVRWFTVHNSFVYNLRLLFSKDTIGPIPPAVLLLSDGGHYQNLAVLPLLQRKVKRIVVVDGGHKDKEDKYGDSILDALKIARTQLNCSFYNEDGKDVIADLMRSFVNPQKRKKPHCYKFKVHYDTENEDGEIILLVPRKPEDILSKEKNKELTFCCCECCHSKSSLCASLSKCLCNAFPQHNTVNQFFTPRMFEAYHEEGRRACEEAKADEFLKTLCPANI